MRLCRNHRVCKCVCHGCVSAEMERICLREVSARGAHGQSVCVGHAGNVARRLCCISFLLSRCYPCLPSRTLWGLLCFYSHPQGDFLPSSHIWKFFTNIFSSRLSNVCAWPWSSHSLRSSIGYALLLFELVRKIFHSVLHFPEALGTLCHLIAWGPGSGKNLACTTTGRDVRSATWPMATCTLWALPLRV